MGLCHKRRSEFGFHVEGNSSSSSSFVGRTVLAEKNVTWETNLTVFETCLCYAFYINMAKPGRVIEFVKFVHERTFVEHGNTQVSFYALVVGLGLGG